MVPLAVGWSLPRFGVWIHFLSGRTHGEAIGDDPQATTIGLAIVHSGIGALEEQCILCKSRSLGVFRLSVDLELFELTMLRGSKHFW
mmetsp:Transcript_2217/g.5191  ORF Transcript_2217/g.5191 Transcript_2217/m.5191 type:complete len:87 (-) Transcript_2217:540-800(-)